MSLEARIKADKRVEDLSHDEDGWWCYLSYGLHTHDGPGSHLIHEMSLTEVRKALVGIRPRTHKCECDECTKALAKRAS